MRERAIVLASFLAIFSAKVRTGLGAWMARNIVISSEENKSKQGPYDEDYTPHVARLFDLFLGEDWRELIVQKSAQSSVSLHALGECVRRIADDPGNIQYVIDSDKSARKINERLQEFLKASPATRALAISEETSLTASVYNLNGMNLWLSGAGSAGQLASSTVMLGIGDEVDKHKDLKGEAPTLDLLRTRLKEQTGSRLIAFSTPTLVSGQIHREFLTGSRHCLYVACPHCAERQQLVFEQLKFAHCKDILGDWDLSRVEKETYYECCSCKGQILDQHKRRMVLGGEWRPTNFIKITLENGEIELRQGWAPGKLSAHLSDLYSQQENVSFGRLAAKFVAGRSDPMKRRDFRQNNLGLPDEDNAAEVNDDHLIRLCGPYKRFLPKLRRDLTGLENEAEAHQYHNKLPLDPLYIAVTADTQDDCSKWVMQAFARNGDQWVLDWGTETYLEDMDALFQREFETRSGEIMRPRMLLIDEAGHRTFEVRQHCRLRFPAVICSRGALGSGTREVGLRDQNLHPDQPHGEQVAVMAYDDRTFRRMLYVDRIARFDAERSKALGLARLYLPAILESEFTRELKRQRLVVVPGTLRKEWDKNVKGDDFGDCLKMGIILDAYLRPLILAEEAKQQQVNAGVST